MRGSAPLLLHEGSGSGRTRSLRRRPRPVRDRRRRRSRRCRPRRPREHMRKQRPSARSRAAPWAAPSACGCPRRPRARSQGSVRTGIIDSPRRSLSRGDETGKAAIWTTENAAKPAHARNARCRRSESDKFYPADSLGNSPEPRMLNLAQAVREQIVKETPPRKGAARKSFTFAGLQRMALWGAMGAGAFLVAVLSARGDVGSQRLAAALHGGPAQTATRNFDAQAETRRLAEAVRGLAADGEQIKTRLASVEHDMNDVTGSVGREIAASNAARAVEDGPSVSSTAATAALIPPAPPAPIVAGAAPARPYRPTPRCSLRRGRNNTAWISAAASPSWRCARAGQACVPHTRIFSPGSSRSSASGKSRAPTASNCASSPARFPNPRTRRSFAPRSPLSACSASRQRMTASVSRCARKDDGQRQQKSQNRAGSKKRAGTEDQRALREKKEAKAEGVRPPLPRPPTIAGAKARNPSPGRTRKIGTRFSRRRKSGKSRGAWPISALRQ